MATGSQASHRHEDIRAFADVPIEALVLNTRLPFAARVSSTTFQYVFFGLV